MATCIICAAFVVAAFGYSPAPVLIVGALVLTVMAYMTARRAALLRMGGVFALFVAGHYYAGSAFGWLMKTGSTLELRVLRFMISDELLIGVSSVVMLISVMIGVYGPGPKTEFQEFLRKHQGDDSTPKN